MMQAEWAVITCLIFKMCTGIRGPDRGSPCPPVNTAGTQMKVLALLSTEGGPFFAPTAFVWSIPHCALFHGCDPIIAKSKVREGEIN